MVQDVGWCPLEESHWPSRYLLAGPGVRSLCVDVNLVCEYYKRLLCCGFARSAGRSPGTEGVFTMARMVRRGGYYQRHPGPRWRRQRNAQHAEPRRRQGGIISHPRCRIPGRTRGRRLAAMTMAPRELLKPRHLRLRRWPRPRRVVTQSNRPRLAGADLRSKGTSFCVSSRSPVPNEASFSPPPPRSP